jgi:hypothetical protein
MATAPLIRISPAVPLAISMAASSYHLDRLLEAESGNSRASDFGASSPGTMCRNVMKRNAMTVATMCVARTSTGDGNPSKMVQHGEPQPEHDAACRKRRVRRLDRLGDDQKNIGSRYAP